MLREPDPASYFGMDRRLRLQRLECQVSALADAVHELAGAIESLARAGLDADAVAATRRAADALDAAGLRDPAPTPARVG
jgi:hypothetical protein